MGDLPSAAIFVSEVLNLVQHSIKRLKPPQYKGARRQPLLDKVTANKAGLAYHQN